MKNEYMKASMDVIEFNADDIISTSGRNRDADTCIVYGEPCAAYEPIQE